jgi:integrase
VTIIPRQRADGTTGYTVQIQRKRNGKVVLNLVQTFDRLAAAEAWENKEKADLAAPGGLERAVKAAKRPRGATLGDAIDRTLTGRVKEVGKTTKGNLRIARRHAIAAALCDEVESNHIVELAQDLLAEDREPVTVGNILSSLGKVFSLARPALGFPLDPQAMPDALAVCRELDKLVHFEAYEGRRRDALPMRRLTAFGIFGMRRLGETCRLLWQDYEPDHKDGPRILVRDMKHPGEKEGNDVWCLLTAEAVAIIEAMPRADERIFPYRASTASRNFTRACEILGVEDLEYLDARRDGISRLIEMGQDIGNVRGFSGHRTLFALPLVEENRRR